jgi:uncharacterized protein YciI
VVTHFAVIREGGPAWDASRPMEEHPGWAEHAEFMDGLADDGFVVLGGPLGDGREILLIVDAESEEAVYARLEADPWTAANLLRVTRLTPWSIRVGAAGTDSH